MDTSGATKRHALHQRIVAELRKVMRLPDDERAPSLRQIAGLLVELRGFHTTKDGLPDWRGQSWAYRSEVGEIYDEAGLDAAGEGSLKVALRYHIGNALREDLTPEQLEEVGLHVKPPRERTAGRYKKGANDAEFARVLVTRMVRSPGEKPDPLTAKHARALRDQIDSWLRSHGMSM